MLPAKDCVPVVTTPPLVAFAGDKFKTPELILAPFTFDVLVIVPTEMELLFVKVSVPLPVEVKTCPLVPELISPVPPFATATVVPLHTPLVIVPTVAKFDKEVNEVLFVAVIFPAVVAVAALPVVF